MSTPDFVYWASAALMWIVTLVTMAVLVHYRRRLMTATQHQVLRAEEAAADAPLAEWCRHMSLTVVTVTGAVFSTTFAELQASDVPEFRNWNVPTQVTVWSTLAEPELLDAVPAAITPDDAHE